MRDRSTSSQIQFRSTNTMDIDAAFALIPESAQHLQSEE
jgi:hypothetical protein